MRLGRLIATPWRLTIARAFSAADDPVMEQVGAERTARASGCGVFANAESRRQHAAVDGLGAGRLRGEEEDRQLRAAPLLRSIASMLFCRAPTASTAVRVRSGTNRNGTPHDTDWTGRRSTRSPALTPIAAASAARSSITCPERWQWLGHPGERQPALVPFERHRYRTDAELEHETLASTRDDAFVGQRERAADRGMAGHRQLLSRREDPHPHIAAALGRIDEGRLGERHLLGNLLHLLRGECARLRVDGELIAFEWRRCEDVQVEISELRHSRSLVVAAGGDMPINGGGVADCRLTDRGLKIGTKRPAAIEPISNRHSVEPPICNRHFVNRQSPIAIRAMPLVIFDTSMAKRKKSRSRCSTTTAKRGRYARRRSQRPGSGRAPRGSAVPLPELRALGHHLPGVARRPRRAEAGPAPHPLHDVAAEPDR